MGYSAEVLKRARLQLESNNTQIQARAAMRLNQAYNQIPRLKEIDGQLRRTMVLAAQAAFAKGDADTVWYKKGLYYTAAVILAAVVYVFTYHGVEVIDWVTTLISGLF
jgi:hypothetical protein